MTASHSDIEFAPATGPLAGLKVVELGQLIAGPFAAKTLGDFGADVIKIEPPLTGDPLRQWRLLKDGTSVFGAGPERPGLARHRAPAGARR